MFDSTTEIIAATGVATFFFGFGAGALLNLYLSRINSPLVAELRASLTYVSSIVGDGLLLPVLNMIIVWYLLEERSLINQPVLAIALFLGLCVTAYFHIVQAVRGLVNWTMPQPWHWNVLGVWHAIYMLTVCTLVWTFYAVAIRASFSGHAPWIPLGVVSAGLASFFFLLRLDYATVEWGALLPGHEASEGR